MLRFATRRGPPAKSLKLFVLWAIALGFLLQSAAPFALSRLGAKSAALLSVYPGWLPTLGARGGWFAAVSPLGYALMFGIGAVVDFFGAAGGIQILCLPARRSE